MKEINKTKNKETKTLEIIILNDSTNFAFSYIQFLPKVCEITSFNKKLI